MGKCIVVANDKVSKVFLGLKIGFLIVRNAASVLFPNFGSRLLCVWNRSNTSRGTGTYSKDDFYRSSGRVEQHVLD